MGIGPTKSACWGSLTIRLPRTCDCFFSNLGSRGFANQDILSGAFLWQHPKILLDLFIVDQVPWLA